YKRQALYKAFEAAKIHLPQHGTILLTVKDEDKKEAVKLAQRFHELGFQLVATKGTAQALHEFGLQAGAVAKIAENSSLLNLITTHQVQLVVNTVSNENASAADGALIRQTAIAHEVPLFTALDTVAAILQVLEAQSFVTQAL
ncbi:carbamoyl-phosphate synthase large subunit, partial [Lactobacillus sp. XV13L]|nr:carbamoyl-phosphate synthase large subunit [Lactobacillus sp. XV13L]